MKVRDLIEELKRCGQDRDVFIAVKSPGKMPVLSDKDVRLDIITFDDNSVQIQGWVWAEDSG